MGVMTLVMRWGWVLGVALLAPVALPAGGGELNPAKIRRREFASPLLAGDRCALRTSPFSLAPSLRTLELGTPLKVLRFWKNEDGNEWIQVNVNSVNFAEMPCCAKRGWISV